MFADDSEDDEDGDELPQMPAADPIIEAKVQSLTKTIQNEQKIC